MQEKTVYRVALISLVLGLSFLFIFAEESKLDFTPSIADIPAEEHVNIKGTVSKLSQQENAYFLDIQGCQTIETNVVLFNDQPLYLKEGDYLEISGQVEEYNNKKEIIADSVWK